MRNKSQKPVVGLALSGGSTWGVAHVGVIKALLENDIPIDVIAGTSAGSLVAACYAFGMSIEDMVVASGTVNWKKLSKFSYSRFGLRSNSPMREYITDLLGEVNIQDAATPLAIVAADIQSHEKVVLKKGSLHDAIRASTAIPGLFKPIPLGDRLLVDGGVAENLPIPTVRDMGATIAIGVRLSSRPGSRVPKSLLGVLSSSLSSLTYHRDVALGQGADVLIEPELGDFDYSSFKNSEHILQAGYDAALKVMSEIKEKLGYKNTSKQGWRRFFGL